jgi:hypothetical protein
MALTLKKLTHKRAIRLAELAFASRIEKPFVYFCNDEDIIYVFDDRKNKLDDEYVKTYGLSHLTNNYDFMEIDSSFNIQINGNHMCNVALIYKLVFSWGYEPSLTHTGLFPKSKFEPKTLLELETQKSDDLTKTKK